MQLGLLQFAIRFPASTIPHHPRCICSCCCCILLIAERHLIDPDLPSAPSQDPSQQQGRHHCCPSFLSTASARAAGGVAVWVSRRVMGSCVSKKAARAGAGAKGKVAAPLPVVEKESAHHAQLPPVLEVEAEVEEEEEEVKEVVLSETPAPPRPPPPPEPVKRRKAEQPEADDEVVAASETCSASDSAASVASSAVKEKAKVHEAAGWERELAVEKRAVDAPEKAKTTARRTAAPEESRERESRKLKGGGAGGGNGHGRARSPSPSSAHRRQQQHPPAPRPRREQPAVVSGIGCRSGRFSPSAARRAAESAAAVRRTHSAREADMALPSSKRSLSLINGNVAAGGHGGGGSAALSRRDPGERSGRRSDSPTGSSRRASACPSPSAAIHHRPASPMRSKAAAKERHGTPERARPPPRVVRDGDERAPALFGGGVGGEQKKVAEGGEEGAPLGHNNPSVAMECFIFL